MKTRRIPSFARVLLIGAAALPLLAHHSFAMFDTSKQVDVSGTVKDFQYTNPHSWLIVEAPQSDGKVVEWMEKVSDEQYRK